SPPAIAVSDPTILSSMADGVILVFHGKITTVAAARQTRERFDAIRRPILGVVLNGINVEDPDYTYYRNYYGSHYADPSKDEGNSRVQTVVAIEANRDVASPDKMAVVNFATTVVVPKTFFDVMLSKLAEAAGPMARLILDDHIARLGETREAFPTARLRELIDAVCQEILDHSLKTVFEKEMYKEIQSL